MRFKAYSTLSEHRKIKNLNQSKRWKIRLNLINKFQVSSLPYISWLKVSPFRSPHVLLIIERNITFILPNSCWTGATLGKQPVFVKTFSTPILASNFLALVDRLGQWPSWRLPGWARAKGCAMAAWGVWQRNARGVGGVREGCTKHAQRVVTTEWGFTSSEVRNMLNMDLGLTVNNLSYLPLDHRNFCFHIYHSLLFCIIICYLYS